MSSVAPNYSPFPSFTTLSSIAVVVGIVVGVGIFRLPPIVAGYSGSEFQFIFFWVAGGVISLTGALCYAEIASFKPDTGGEYFFLSETFGPSIGFIFSWGRMLVIQTGSIALIAFIMGDYASIIANLGPYSTSIYAAVAIIGLTGLNLLGTILSGHIQKFLTSLIVLIIILLSITALIYAPSDVVSHSSQMLFSTEDFFTGGSAGLAMIFVLLTYGGWNEAAYLSGELYNVKRNMVKVLVYSICLITVLYVLVNVSYIRILGLEVLQDSSTAGTDLSTFVFGSTGTFILAVIIIISALSTANATIITGARTNYALGRDFRLLGFLGKWNKLTNSPSNALMVQGLVALILVGLGTWSKETVNTIVEYTAPIFWFFMFMIILTLFITRYRFGSRVLPYKVPLFPLTPFVFLTACIYMLYSSLVYTGIGAFIGVFILLAGLPVYFLAIKLETKKGH